jgi:hypothetical protein
VADEDLALEGDGAQVEDTEGAVQDDTPEPIAKLATDLGWTPKDQWAGDPEKWKPAEQFIRDGRDIQQTTSRELRSLREQMERIGGVTEAIVQDKLAERDAEWQRKMTQAVDDGDTETALKLADQRPKAKANGGPGADPQVAEWVDKNAWYNTDPLAQARATELSDRLAHLPVPEQLKQVERAIRKEFPEHFPAPTKQPPATQTGGSRNPNPSNRVKGFAQMPDDARTLALDYEERLGVKKEDFAQSYWRNREGVSR